MGDASEKPEVHIKCRLFFVIRRRNTSLFIEANPGETLFDLRKKICPILEVECTKIRLHWNTEVLTDDEMNLQEFLIRNKLEATCYAPLQLGLTLKTEEGTWEELIINNLSEPEELPEMLLPTKGQAELTHTHEAAAMDTTA